MIKRLKAGWNNNLEDFQLGQESGLRYFMAKFGHSLRFFAYSIIRNKATAEEIVSDSFYKLWQRREKVRSIDNIKAFLYISTRNACYDYTGMLKNRVHTEENVLETIVCPNADILTQIIYAELVQLIAMFHLIIFQFIFVLNHFQRLAQFTDKTNLDMN